MEETVCNLDIRILLLRQNTFHFTYMLFAYPQQSLINFSAIRFSYTSDILSSFFTAHSKNYILKSLWMYLA